MSIPISDRNLIEIVIVQRLARHSFLQPSGHLGPFHLIFAVILHDYNNIDSKYNSM